ncbi:4-carboxymuconolactone decarboxylase [Breoghania corrubedonensis]|uniref:4-carboxymuconolactone decarboxylase n=1 Tax=Breoghania corrubedonensis TaxID=665038 RepID=A0A2T5VE68_9HYPH|nr:carboxymuconolactone decarboxylase family protein [Breoghania corrubedonensis]PTW62033.1 4-carboxymuconolactone decarboxylase [Breoghania corrubedonensis]
MSERYERGLAALTALNGPDGVAVIDKLSEFAPAFGEQLVEFIFGDVYTRPQLDLRTRQIVTISALAAMGFALPQLEIHVRGGLRAGLTREELTEIIHHVAAYSGFPAALNAMAVVRRVCAEAEAAAADTH